MTDDPRLSDEATGLPPLSDLDDEATVVVLAWDASEGIASVYGAPEAVRYLHVRGLTIGGPTGVQWTQVHLAVPVEVAMDVAAALAKGSTEELA